MKTQWVSFKATRAAEGDRLDAGAAVLGLGKRREHETQARNRGCRRGSRCRRRCDLRIRRRVVDDADDQRLRRSGRQAEDRRRRGRLQGERDTAQLEHRRADGSDRSDRTAERRGGGPQGATGPQGPAGSSAPNPDAVVATVSVHGQQQGDFSQTPIDVTAISHEIVSPRDPATGLPTGKRQHKPITLTMTWGPSTPRFLSALVNNENLTTFRLSLLRDGQEVARIELMNASVSQFDAARLRRDVPVHLPEDHLDVARPDRPGLGRLGGARLIARRLEVAARLGRAATESEVVLARTGRCGFAVQAQWFGLKASGAPIERRSAAMPETGDPPIRVYKERDMWHVDYGEGVTQAFPSREEAESAADAVAEAEDRPVVVEE